MSPARDPYAEYESVRRRGVLVKSRMGLYLTASHELCSSLLRDPGFGSLSPGVRFRMASGPEDGSIE